ncbi:protein kinase domain-containing protein [Endozoicomonas sp. 2B-B]
MNIRMVAHIPTLTESGSPTIVVQSSASNGNSSPTDQGCLRNPCNIASSAYHFVLGRFRRTHVNEHVNGRMLDSKLLCYSGCFVLKQETWELPEGRKIYARKCLNNRAGKKLLINEKKMLRAAQGPNIVPFIKTKDKSLLMPFAGEPLICILARDRGRGLPRPKFESYAQQLMQGVAHLHHSGIWHLDLKLANVLVDESDEDKLTIIDFGLSQRAGRAKNKDPGTMGYKSPEMICWGHKALSAKTDIFAAGVILFELLTNYRLFPHSINFLNKGYVAKEDSYYEYLNRRLQLLEDIDNHHAQLIRSMLVWNPKDRPDADEVLGDLLRY